MSRTTAHRMRRPLAVVPLIVFVAWSAGCAGVRPRAGATPTVELVAGFSGPQLPQAEFPGVIASVAVILPRAPTWGAALVAEADGAYLQLTRSAGLRMYVRSGPLFSPHRAVTWFAQLLAGTTRGGVSGVIRSEGGLAVAPGLGLDYGAGVVAFHAQVDYLRVPSGLVYDSRVPGQSIDRLSGTRVSLGMTWRLRPR